MTLIISSLVPFLQQRSMVHVKDHGNGFGVLNFETEPGNCIGFKNVYMIYWMNVTDVEIFDAGLHGLDLPALPNLEFEY